MSDTPSSPVEPTPQGSGEGDPIPTAPAAPTPTTPVPEPTPVQKAGWKSWAAAGGVAVVVVVGGIVVTRHHSSSTTPTLAAANASPGQGLGRFGQRGAAGTITSIKGGTITIDAIERGTSTPTTTTPVTVKTTSATTYSEVVKGAVTDLKAGDTVLVRGTQTGSTIAATDVVEGGVGGQGGQGLGGQARRFEGAPPEGATPPTDASGQPIQPGQGQGRFAGGGFTAGKIASIDGDSFTVTQRDGSTVTVTTTSATTVSVTKTISRSDLAKGDTILVTGDRSGDTITATTIRKGDAGQMGAFGFGGPGGFFGRGADTTSTTAATS